MFFKIDYSDGVEDRVTVELSPQDTWSADWTLAYVIAPLLKQLKESAHGSAFVDDCDVPEHLHKGEDQYGWPSNGRERWDWVLDEMIWAFTVHTDVDADAEFFDLASGVHNSDGYGKFNKRKQNAFKLFGKYFQNLWD